MQICSENARRISNEKFELNIKNIQISDVTSFIKIDLDQLLITNKYKYHHDSVLLEQLIPVFVRINRTMTNK